MRRFATAIALLGAAALFVGAVGADEPNKGEAKKLTTKEFSPIMKAAHRGDKSPHTRVVAELKKDTPDWVQLAKDVKAFEDVGEAFKGVRMDYVSPAGYVKGVAALKKSVGDKDKKAANEAFLGLTKTCGACHSYGGPANALAFDSDKRLK
jgi:hypothetical protein